MLEKCVQVNNDDSKDHKAELSEQTNDGDLDPEVLKKLLENCENVDFLRELETGMDALELPELIADLHNLSDLQYEEPTPVSLFGSSALKATEARETQQVFCKELNDPSPTIDETDLWMELDLQNCFGDHI